MDTNSVELACAVERWYNDPELFANEVFDLAADDILNGLEGHPGILDAWQSDICTDIVEHDRVAAIACKGPGKSAIAAIIGWWWLVTRGPEVQVICTSITGDNLKSGLWKELSLWRSRSTLLQHMFTWTKSEIYVNDKLHSGHWKAEARTWAKDADPAEQGLALAGIHQKHLLFIMDEAGGYPQAIMATIEAGLSSGDELKIFMIGNPTHNEGPLYDAATKDRHLWRVTHVTGDPDDPKRSPRISKEWAQQQIDKWPGGRKSSYVMVNVLGQFPLTSENALLGPEEVRRAMERQLSDAEYRFSQKRFGIDVARFGPDDSVIFPRQGLLAGDPIITPLKDASTDMIVAHAMFEKNRNGCEIMFVDGTGGFGAGVVDGLIQSGESPVEVHFSSRALDERYGNKRAEMWFEMAAWVKRGGKLPNDPQLARELTSIHYKVSKNGKVFLESKEDLKKRLGFSPDRADALALTFALPEMPGNLESNYSPRTGRKSDGRMDTDWNPIARKKR